MRLGPGPSRPDPSPDVRCSQLRPLPANPVAHLHTPESEAQEPCTKQCTYMQHLNSKADREGMVPATRGRTRLEHVAVLWDPDGAAEVATSHHALAILQSSDGGTRKTSGELFAGVGL